MKAQPTVDPLGPRVLVASTGIVYHTKRDCRGLRRAGSVSVLYQREAELYFRRSACYVCQPLKTAKGN